MVVKSSNEVVSGRKASVVNSINDHTVFPVVILSSYKVDCPLTPKTQHATIPHHHLLAIITYLTSCKHTTSSMTYLINSTNQYARISNHHPSHHFHNILTNLSIYHFLIFKIHSSIFFPLNLEYHFFYNKY